MKREPTGAIVIIVALFFIFVILKYTSGPTGMAVANLTDQDIMNDIQSLPMLNMMIEGKICMIVDTPNGAVSYDITKSNGIVDVVKSDNFYCSGQYNEDFIIHYIDYNSFLDDIANPSWDNFVSGRGGNSYYILPSKYVDAGGNVVCNDDFKSKFCPLINSYVKDEGSLIKGDLVCCIDHPLTKQEIILLKEHLSNPNFVDESGALSKPAGKVSPSGTIIFSIIIIIIIVAVIVGILKGKKKAGKGKKEEKGRLNLGEEEIDEELRGYIRKALSLGYPENELRQKLLNVGWKEDVIDREINYIKTQFR